MEEYRRTVEAYASRHENYLFHNEGNEHALIIFENIFRNANDTIRIAANNLCNPEVVDRKEYVEPLIKFLDNGGTLKILLKVAPNPSSEELKKGNCLYRALFNHEAYKKGAIQIKSGEGKCFHDSEHKEIHFCTADGHMYRIENDIVERKAICNFGDEVKTKEIDDLFDRVFDSVHHIVDLGVYFK